jgi:diguanylate cyclase (GGDEF)-like protein
LRPAFPSGVEKAGREARAREEAACSLKAIYRAIAGQAPLGETLGEIARLACAGLERAVAVVFGLRGERLETLASSSELPLWLRPPSQVPAAAAPWWPLRGRAVEMSESAIWAPYRGLGGGAGWCWSDRLQTAAGEIVGCLTLFSAERMEDGCGGAETEELKELAALAIEQANLLEELRFRAEHDVVTGLWNRQRLEEELQRLRAPGREAQSPLVLVALEGARRAREILGEETGDALLRQAAERLRRLPGTGFAARLSGDEVVILPETDGVAPQEIGVRLLEALDWPFRLDGHEIHAQPAVGVAVGGREEDLTQWLRRARAAAAAARGRRNGRRCVIFDPTVAMQAPERLEMERRLRGAADRGELLLYYQPQVRVRDRSVAGHEALMRWASPGVGMVSPGAFIPLAEETGLVVEMGRWALGEACRRARLWERQGLPARVGVNVSALQLADAGFVRDVEQALRASGLRPGLLELEITESAVMENRKQAAERMEALRRLGVEFALDDFGTGSSSLAYLKDLPVDRLKVDRSFVSELERGAAPLLESIIRMAHQLGLPVIVEGVETERQWAALAAMGADEVQGYLTGKPMPAEEAGKLAGAAGRAGQSDI